jgi:hypothetical protein
MDNNKKTTRPFNVQIIDGKIPQVKNLDMRYAYIPFRLLSADSVIGAGGWNCSLFSKKVLQEAAELWEGTVLRVDHSLSTKNILGNIVDVWFDEGSIQNGVRIPAGVNGFFKVNREEFSTEVELLTSDPSGIRATSAGVAFAFEPSHEFENEYDFWYHVGETINGEYVHFKVTKIEQVIEQSAVWDGADPCAVMLASSENGVIFKYLKENNILNEDRMKALKARTENATQFKSELKKEMPKGIGRFAKMTFITNLSSSSLSTTDAENTAKVADKSEIEKEEIKAELGQEVELEAIPDVSKEELKARDTTIIQLQISLEEEKQTVLKLQTQLAFANKKLKENEEFVNLSKQLLTKKQDYTKEVYAKLGREVTPKIDAIIMKADFDSLDSLIESWGGQAMTQFGEPKCTKCGSNDFTVRQTEHVDLADERKEVTTENLVEKALQLYNR